MINIAKLLKDAPVGMKLYSPLFGEVKFKYINSSKFGIVVEDSEECCRSFDKYGRYFTIYNNAECLLFPSKDCRTWEGWKVPVEPKFKVGDDIETGNTIDTIAEIDHATRRYYCESGRTISFENQDFWHLVPKPHYDISNFKPFDKVLVREANNRTWAIDFFGFVDEDNLFICSGYGYYPQCIPFNDDTKHLLGTTDMPSEEYINW
jgi:hypothetical protein